MLAITRTRTLALSAALVLPAAFIVVSGILLVAFDIEGPNRLFEAMYRTPLIGVVVSPIVVIGAAGLAVALNVSHFCRVWFGPERGTVNLSVSFGGSLSYLAAAMTSSVMIGVIMLYGAKYAIRAAVHELMR